MFIGHFAVALAAKPGAPRASLGWLFAACQLPDLVWPVMLPAGAERARIAPGDTKFIGLVGFLLVAEAANIVCPRPPNKSAVAVGGFAIWLLVWWGAWADRHRQAHDVTRA